MPHAGSESGIGCAFSQAPFAYSKKSSPGLMLTSMFDLRKSSFRAGVTGTGGGVLQAAIEPASDAAINRRTSERGPEGSAMIDSRAGDQSGPGPALILPQNPVEQLTCAGAR